MSIRVVHRREYLSPGGVVREVAIEFVTMQSARRFIKAVSPYLYRTDEHGNRVRDSHARLAH